MTGLEDIKHGAMVRGVAPGHSVQIISVDWIGNQAVNLVYRDPNGGVSETTLYRDDEHRLDIDARGRIWSFDGDGALLRLVTEANRIELAHHFDPYLSIHTSLVDPLPHQISAVYGEMLSRQPLRFLLADDPGAGKTIMAGLLIKELLARSGPGALPHRRPGKPRRAVAGRAGREIRPGVRHPHAGHDRVLTLGQPLRRP